MNLERVGLNIDFERFYAEDDLSGNVFYTHSLPDEDVECVLKIKSDLLISGLPLFVAAFNHLGAQLDYSAFKTYEGRQLKSGESVKFILPFSIALSGERVALNLLQHSCRISTFTNQFVKKARDLNIAILDTRKTTPGLRSIEKYAVRVGGGHNHRFSQVDAFMIKDNHKTFFNGLRGAWEYFQSMQSFYQPIIVEIHSLDELQVAFELGVKHIMLDNFNTSDLKKAIQLKKSGVTYEVSGGIKLDNIENFLISGVDAISIGALTHSAPHVDLSMKITGKRR